MGKTISERIHNRTKKPAIIDKKTRIDFSLFLIMLIVPVINENIPEIAARE